MGEDAERHLLVLVVIRRVVITDQVDDCRCGYRRFEESRLRNQPCAELSAIADAFHSDTIAIDPEVAAHGGAHAVQHVLPLVSVLIAENCVCKCLPVTGRTAIVYHQRRPPETCINLILKIEGWSLLPVGSPVDHYDKRVFRSGCRA